MDVVVEVNVGLSIRYERASMEVTADEFFRMREAGMLTRSGMYTGAGYQAAMRQTVALGATRDGQLTAVRHRTLSVSSMFDDYIEYGTAGTRGMYAAPALQTITRRQTPT